MINNLEFSLSDTKNYGLIASLLDSISHPVILLTRNKIVHINASAIRLLEIDKKKLSIEELFDIDDTQNLISLNKISRLSDISSDDQDLEVLLRPSANPDSIVKCKANPVEFVNRKYVMLELSKADIIHHEADNNPDDFISGLFNEFTFPVCIINNELELKRYNGAFKKLFGIDESAIFDKYFLLKNLPNGVKREFSQIFIRQLNNTGKVKEELDVKIHLESRGDLFLSIEIFGSAEKHESIIVLKDQTRETRLFRDLEKATKQAKNLKSIFVAQMSHEIRTPINAILSFANLIKEELKDNLPPDIHSGFEVINRGGERIIRTINLILDTSEVMTDSYEFFPSELDLFTDVFNEVFLKYRKIANSKNIECNYTRNTNDLMVLGDEYMIKQIFSNILDNAVKFTNEGQIESNIDTDDSGRILVKIKDSGIGMSQKYIDKIYEPFTQEDEGLRRRYEGNGLGLTLVKSYCDINNIDISITSDKSSGTEVTLVFNNILGDISIDETEDHYRLVNSES